MSSSSENDVTGGRSWQRLESSAPDDAAVDEKFRDALGYANV